MKLYLGTSGWYYEHWIKRFYPPGMDKKEWLTYYAKTFNTVEINSTFYRFPFKNMLKGWYDKTPKDFIFTLKANKLITHNKKLADTKNLLSSFYSLADMLKEKLGPILFQLPPSLKKDTERLANFIKQLPSKYTNVFEFRHETWFCDEIYNLLSKYNITYCIVSSKEMPLDIRATTKIAYIRFHGPSSLYSSQYSLKQLKDIASKLKKLKVKKLFAYFNNDTNAYAVKNCKQLKKII